MTLHTSDIDSARIVQRLAVDMVDRHMAHKEHKAYPWHIWTFDVGSDSICTSSTNEKGTYAIPEIE